MLRAVDAAGRRALCTYTLLVGAACGGGVPPERRPSVILISLDTLRAGHMSLHGYGRETTPYLERLAEECLVFDEAHSVAPWTLISHVTMLTGLFPEQHGVVSGDLALSPEIPFLAERLRDFGYQTLALYRPGWISERHGEDRGFDVFQKHSTLSHAEVNLKRFLPEVRRERPFFLFLHLFDIHADPLTKRGQLMYDPPAPYDSMFLADAKERLQGINYVAIKNTPEHDLDPDQLEATVALYDGKIRWVDDTLAEWIEGWRQEGLLDDTLLVITSDHGEGLGQRGTLSGHGGMWEDALHIPLIVRFPDGHRAGERDPRLVSLVDVVPTILEVTGLPADERLPGYSLRGEIPGDRVVGALKDRGFANIQLPYKVKGRVRRRGRDLNEVYHIEDDPLELAPVLPGEEGFDEISQRIVGSYQEVLANTGFDAPPIPAVEQDEEMRAELEALGYGGEGDAAGGEEDE